MRRKQPFKRHRFPALIILSAVRMYLRYPLSYQDVVDLLGERGVDVDRSTVSRLGRNWRNARKVIYDGQASTGMSTKPTFASAENGVIFGGPLMHTTS